MITWVIQRNTGSHMLRVNHPVLIVVYDNSPDGTAEIAAELAGDYPTEVCVRKNERGLATGFYEWI